MRITLKALVIRPVLRDGRKNRAAGILSGGLIPAGRKPSDTVHGLPVNVQVPDHAERMGLMLNDVVVDYGMDAGPRYAFRDASV